MKKKRKLKIALVAPAGAMHRYNGSFSLPLHYAPLTLTTLASLIPKDIDAEVTIFDETVEPIPNEFEQDLICITAITGTSIRAYTLAKKLRRLGHTVVLGGIHPSLMPFEAKKYADSVVIGFAEHSFPKLIEDFLKNSLQPYYQIPVNSLENKPIPRRDLLKKWRYSTTASIEATRGCFHACNFCIVPTAWGQKLLRRPIKEVVSELEILPGKNVVFIDLNLIADKKYAKKLFTEMISIGKNWFGLATSLLVHDIELIKLMAKSGCKGLLIGFETVRRRSNYFINKGWNKVDDYIKLVDILHDNGIGVNGTFMFGADYDDESVFEETLEFVLKAKIDLPRYAILTPFPNTPLFKKLEAEGRILTKNWSLYDVEHVVFKPKLLTPEQLEEGLLFAWRETYRFVNIAKRIKDLFITTPSSFLLNLAYKHYAHKLPTFTPKVMSDHSDLGIVS